MIVDKSEDKWIWVLPSEHRKPRGDIVEYLRYHGKWLIFSKDRTRLDELARKLDPYVESGEISSVKYSREPNPMFGTSLVMCVYCDDRDMKKVWRILSSLGIKQRIWKYDRQTFKDWLPGGRLYKRAKKLAYP